MTVSSARLPTQVDPLIGEAKRRTRRRRLALAGAFLLVAIAVATIAVKAAAGHSSPAAGLRTSPAVFRSLVSGTGCTSGQRPAIGKFPGDTNHDGLISDSGGERIPALVAAVGDHGTAGYVKVADVFCQPAPVSPAAALASQGKPRKIPVYAANGTTVIDTLTAQSGTGQSFVASP
jgi:hypothetical protein